MDQLLNLLPPKQREKEQKRLDAYAAKQLKAALSDDEAKQLAEFGNIETTIDRAVEILIVKKTVVAASLDTNVKRSQITNYVNSGRFARVYPESRKLEIVRYDGNEDLIGTVINKGVMP